MIRAFGIRGAGASLAAVALGACVAMRAAQAQTPEVPNLLPTLAAEQSGSGPAARWIPPSADILGGSVAGVALAGSPGARATPGRWIPPTEIVVATNVPAAQDSPPANPIVPTPAIPASNGALATGDAGPVNPSSPSSVSLSSFFAPADSQEDGPPGPYAAIANSIQGSTEETSPLEPIGGPPSGSSAGALGIRPLSPGGLGSDKLPPPPKLLGVPMDETQWELLHYTYKKVYDGMELGVIELFCDYGNLISYRSISLLALSLATAGTLANTSLDQQITNWSDQHVRSPTSDRIAQDFRMFGNGMNTIPVFVVTAFAGPFTEEAFPVMGPIGQWGNRSIQAMLAAGPMEVFLNQALGSGRPVAGEGSQWRPFHDSHGVSGHAYMGAIPFLTVASMTDNVGVKVVMVLLSFGAGWSRVNDDMHYTSEVFMGWSMAFMGVDAVTRTKSGRNDFLFQPAILPGGAPGVQLAINF